MSVVLTGVSVRRRPRGAVHLFVRRQAAVEVSLRTGAVNRTDDRRVHWEVVASARLRAGAVVACLARRAVRWVVRLLLEAAQTVGPELPAAAVFVRRVLEAWMCPAPRVAVRADGPAVALVCWVATVANFVQPAVARVDVREVRAAELERQEVMVVCLAPRAGARADVRVGRVAPDGLERSAVDPAVGWPQVEAEARLGAQQRAAVPMVALRRVAVAEPAVTQAVAPRQEGVPAELVVARVGAPRQAAERVA